MAEAVKQFFVGFIHPRTWLAALIGLVVAVIGNIAIGGALTGFFSSLLSSLTGGSIPAVTSQLSAVGFGTFVAMLFVYSSLVAGTALPLVILLIGSIVAGLVFGALSKKERVASKSIVGGLNMAIIYTVLVVVAIEFWLYYSLSTFSTSSIGPLYSKVVALLQAAPVDVLVMLIIVWWVSAIVSMLVLSVKHD
jgi:hypothetical protein